jgi:hypothetical protein
MKWLSILGFVSLAAACTPQDLTPAQTRSICHAMVGPIRYNTYDKTSQRYAAQLLALDLKQRNQIYVALKCLRRR